MAEAIAQHTSHIVTDQHFRTEFFRNVESTFITTLSNEVIRSRERVKRTKKGVSLEGPQADDKYSGLNARNFYLRGFSTSGIDSSYGLEPANERIFRYLLGQNSPLDITKLDRFDIVFFTEGKHLLNAPANLVDLSDSEFQGWMANALDTVTKVKVMTAKALFKAWSNNGPPPYIKVEQHQLPPPESPDEVILKAYHAMYESRDDTPSHVLARSALDEYHTLMEGSRLVKARSVDSAFAQDKVEIEKKAIHQGERNVMQIATFVNENWQQLVEAQPPTSIAELAKSDLATAQLLKQDEFVKKLLRGEIPNIQLVLPTKTNQIRLIPVLLKAFQLWPDKFPWDDTKNSFLITQETFHDLQLLVEFLGSHENLTKKYYG